MSDQGRRLNWVAKDATLKAIKAYKGFTPEEVRALLYANLGDLSPDEIGSED